MAGIPAGAGSLLGKRLGKYEVVALLALGGTAEIYLARIAGAAGFEKYVVVKCLHDHLADDQEFVKMFLDEARLAAHLDHSNVVQTFELGEYQNRYYMVMEFLAGLSLAMIVRRVGERSPDGRMPVPLALNIVSQACGGLHYAHEKGSNGKPLNIVHRDISPQNLVVSFEGVVKVVDFGIAKAELRETRTRSGTIKGKFAYMSPEQCVANNVDRRTDVFALGVIAHELLTGRRLFKRPSPYETYQAVIECNVEPPSQCTSELDPNLDTIVMKAVAKDKEQRYPTAEAFGDALQSYLHHRGKGSGPSDVGRFLDEAFAQEIEEHGARMRELIEGRVIGAGGWDEEEEMPPKKASRQSETVALRGPRDQAVAASRDSDASLTDEVTPAPHDDSDMPADRTRIETNPLERLSASEITGTPTPPTAPPMMQAPPKFPAAANIPTMIAEPDDDEDAPTHAPELAATELGALPVDGSSAPPFGGAARSGGAGPFDPRGGTRQQPTVAMAPNGRTSAPRQPVVQSASSQQPTVAVVPGMSSPLSPPPLPAPPMAGSGSAQMQAMQGMQQQPNYGMQQPMPNYGPSPSQMPMQPPVQARPANVYDTGPYGAGGGGGAQEPSRNEWTGEAAVTSGVRAAPAWLLAVLFLASLGVALGVTFTIAVIIR